MATLTSAHVQPTQGGFDAPAWASDLYRFAFTEHPSAQDMQQRLGGAALVSDWPVSACPRTISAVRSGAYIDDYYHRIHISPRQLDLGNVVSAQSTPVNIWNAFLTPLQLNSISGLEEGLSAIGQPAPPFTFAALKELTWQVTVTPDGSPVLDTEVAWQFDNGAEAGLRITANRIIGFTFVPQWAEPVVERLSFLTDLMQSESAASQRRGLRKHPRRELRAEVFAEGQERQLLDLALFGWSDRIWALPIWPDIQRLAVGVSAGSDFIACTTEHLDFRDGGLAMLRGENAFTSETVEISQVQAGGLKLKRDTQQSWPAGTRLYPARSAQLLKEPELSKRTDRLMTFNAEFLVVEPCSWPNWLPSRLYRSVPVWDRLPDDSENLTHSAARLRSTLDSQMAQPLITDTARRALQLLGQRHLDLGRQARALVRSFIYAMHGRCETVWVPSHMDDLTLVATASALGTTLDVAYCGYTRFSNGKAGRRDIYIVLTDGTVLMRRILNATELSTSVERLGLDSALGREVTPAQVARISWMNLMRFESDSQEIEHIADSQGLAHWSPVFKEERDDEL